MPRARSFFSVVHALVFAALPLAGRADDPVRMGAAVRVAAQPALQERSPDVAADASGAFVVAWLQTAPDGTGPAIRARRFDPSGLPQGPELAVDDGAVSLPGPPAVAMDPSGGFVVTWSGRGPLDPSGGVFARRYGAGGEPSGPPFLVNAHTTGPQGSPAIASGADGSFTVAWEGDGPDGSGVAGRRFEASGAASGPDAVVSAGSATNWRPSVAMSGDGGAVIAWQRIDWETGGRYAVFGRRYDAAGAPRGPEFRVSDDVPWQTAPVVAADPGGAFFVSWTDATTDADGDEVWPVFARAYGEDGQPVTAAFEVAAATTSYPGRPSVSAQGAGAFLVTWIEERDGGSDLLLRRHELSGAVAPPAVRINPLSPHAPTRPRLAASGSHAVVAMMGPPEGRFDYDVLAQRLGPDAIFRDGFESGSTDAWTAVATGAGGLLVCAPAAMGGSAWGLQGTIDRAGGSYVQDESPRNESRYRARFRLDATAYDPGEDAGHFRTRVLVAFAANPDRRLLAVVLKRQGGAYALFARARRADGGQVDLGPLPVTAAPHLIEVEWQQSSAETTADGTLQLWIDDGLAGWLTGIATPHAGVEFARLGALSAKTGASGAIYWDEFQSHRESYIGP